MNMQEPIWLVHLDAHNQLRCTCAQGSLVAGRPAVETDAEQAGVLHTRRDDATHTWRCGDNLEFTLAVRPLAARPAWLELRAQLRNTGTVAVALQKVMPLVAELVDGATPFDACFVQGPTMCEVAAVQPLAGMPPAASHMVAGFTNQAGGAALLLGFAAHDASFNNIAIARDAASGWVTLRATVAREGITLAPGATLELPALLIGAGAPLQTLLADYAAMVAAAMQARPGCFQSGWCSWYGYYGTETAADIAANVALLAQPPWRDHVRVIQIDDGWNITAPGAPRNWGDWHAGYKFPDGMRAVADMIKAHGMVPGLWLAPFSVERASRLFQEHPDWLIRDEHGAPKEFWTVYALDLTHPAVLAFVHETFRRVFDDWGFDYVKIDFLVHAIQPGMRHDPQQTTAELFRNGLRQIRRAAGERFILNCGSPLGPAIGLCDAMRIGYDVSSRWTAMVNAAGWVVGNCAVKPAAVQTIGRQWMHGVLWQNDPDCIVVRDYGTPGEIKVFGEGAYGLNDEEAAMWVRLVWLSGNMTLLSEIMPELRGPRAALMQRVFPPNPAPARVIDWYTQPEVHLLAAPAAPGIPARIGMFNLSDNTVPVALPAARLGLPATWRMQEWLTGEKLHGKKTIEYQLPPHSGRVWEVESEI